MKYTKLIFSFLFLNLIMAFLMIFIANITREIEKENNNLKIEMSKMNQKIKINKLELFTHQNSSYLKKLYSIYFPDFEKNNDPNLISLKQLLKNDKNIRLVKNKN